MPHRPLFVLRCHHFSPVIYFIAISVSLLAVAAVAAMPFLLLHLRLPPSLPPSLPPYPSGRSFFLSPAPSHPPRCAPCLRTPRSKLSTTQRNTIPLSSPSWRLYYTFLSPSHSRSFPFSVELLELPLRFLFRSRCLVPAAFRRRCRVRERKMRTRRRGEGGTPR